jgi:hypothetical protein
MEHEIKNPTLEQKVKVLTSILDASNIAYLGQKRRIAELEAEIEKIKKTKKFLGFF